MQHFDNFIKYVYSEKVKNMLEAEYACIYVNPSNNLLLELRRNNFNGDECIDIIKSLIKNDNGFELRLNDYFKEDIKDEDNDIECYADYLQTPGLVFKKHSKQETNMVRPELESCFNLPTNCHLGYASQHDTECNEFQDYLPIHKVQTSSNPQDVVILGINCNTMSKHYNKLAIYSYAEEDTNTIHINYSQKELINLDINDLDNGSDVWIILNSVNHK